MSTDFTPNANVSGGQYEMFLQTLRIAKVPIIIAFCVTPVRFLLELTGLPENIIFIIGLLWLTLVCAIYWGTILYDAQHAYLRLLLVLAIFSPISRIPVFVLWWVDTHWEIGSHYGLYYTSLTQALISHLVGGALVQIIPGFLVGSITIAIIQYRKSVK